MLPGGKLIPWAVIHCAEITLLLLLLHGFVQWFTVQKEALKSWKFPCSDSLHRNRFSAVNHCTVTDWTLLHCREILSSFRQIAATLHIFQKFVHKIYMQFHLKSLRYKTQKLYLKQIPFGSAHKFTSQKYKKNLYNFVLHFLKIIKMPRIRSPDGLAWQEKKWQTNLMPLYL